MKKHTQRGGARDGAGRKRNPKTVNKTALTVRLTPAAAARFEEIRTALELSQSAAITMLIESAELDES